MGNFWKWFFALLSAFAFGAGGVFALSGHHETKDFFEMGFITCLPTIAALRTTLEKELGISTSTTITPSLTPNKPPTVTTETKVTKSDL